MNLDAKVSARDAASYPAMKAYGVCRHLIYLWRRQGRITPVGKRGRSPLYYWGDILQVERDTRCSDSSYRTAECRSCLRTAERALAA